MYEPTGTARVLVADDNVVDRKILSAIVEKAGYEVIDAVDGNDAVEKFYALKPDLVLLDALMPGKDGFEVAREIKANSGDAFVPIMFLTSLTGASELARCVEAGGDDFLSKPYNRVILQAKLSALHRMRDMHNTVQAQRDEISKHHLQLLSDQEAAKAVFDKVALSRQLEASNIKHMLSPLALFNGDVLLAAQNPARNLYILLGDFTGHGLAAAIGAMPLADVFYSMTGKGFSLTDIIRECNRKLGAVLPGGYFCCATALFIDFAKGTVEYWNGGLPSAYLRRHSSEDLVQLSSNNLPLGILGADKFVDETQVLEVAPGDRLFMATDGVIEARDSHGEYFGADRLENIIGQADISSVFDAVKREVHRFMAEQDRDDDITMVEVTIVEPADLDEIDPLTVSDDDYGPQDWKFSYELGPKSLKEFNPLPLLQQVMMEAPYLRSKASEIYTVMAELYSNALEHGVLGLDSDQKKSAEGFAQYYAARAAALENVVGFVRFEISGLLVDEQVELRICCTDSGSGFDFETYIRRAQEAQDTGAKYHGRGVRLLNDLCQEVQYLEPGNQVRVLMEWNLKAGEEAS
ncbi:MAG: fused response regulator/phosphatase [Gammaproteobacteria bacterium]|nr:fused response regulator/phosphatase [Gammaproteobacteria bacterium]